MSIGPEAMAGPLAQAPPDRPTRDVEQVAKEFIALLFRDGGLDMNERRIVMATFHEIMQRAQAAGGIGVGAGPGAGPAGPPGQPPPSPMDMNANQEDLGSAPGAQPEEGYGP